MKIIAIFPILLSIACVLASIDSWREVFSSKWLEDIAFNLFFATMLSVVSLLMFVVTYNAVTMLPWGIR